MSAQLLSEIPAALWILLAVIVIIAVVLLYALRTKGDVFAKLSHGLTSFELQAKERSRPRNN